METRLTLAPGQNGTKKLLTAYGDRLVCVRYRYDSARGVRHKTVELIVETLPWQPRGRVPRRAPYDMVGVKISYFGNGASRANQECWRHLAATAAPLGNRLENRART